MAPSLSSGRHWTTQIGGRSLAADAAVTSSEASSQGVWRCLAWWGGRGCRDGAPGLLKGTREGPWPRWCKSAAAGAFGHEREEEQRRGMSSVGEGRGTRGFGGVRGKVLGVSVARIRTKGGLQREAGGGRLRGARVFAPAYWQEEDDERGGKWAGPASYSAGPPGWTGRRQVSYM